MNGFKTYTVSGAITDEKGAFQLGYSKSDFGVGYLIDANKKSFLVILNGEEIVLQGASVSNIESVKIIKGQENLWFEQYAKEHPRREQALSAWGYLDKMYKNDALFSIHSQPVNAITNEKTRIEKEDHLFLTTLPSSSYVAWFLPVRKLVSSVKAIAQYRTEEISATIAAFRKLDYADPRLYKSGLLKDAIESHFWLLENSGFGLDSVFTQMKTSVDSMMNYLVRDEKKLNEITDYLFDLLERHSLFQASEYLALKALNQSACTLNSDLVKQLETYRAMKKGNRAPDLFFNAEYTAPGYAEGSKPQKLSDIKSSYTVVVFGAGWCPKCKEELPEIARLYSKWKAQGVEVVFVSLDETKAAYNSFAKDFPFISVCDFKKWGSIYAKDYYVFATPTMFFLDNKREIVLRPNSVKQMDSWIDWYLIQGNLKK